MKKLLVFFCTIVLSLCLNIVALAVYLGDVNNDGNVTAGDARIILRHSAKLDTITEEQLSIADVDNNGKITASDARLTLRMSAKLEELKEEHKHEYTATEIQKQDCEKDGVIEYRCRICDYSYEDVTKATGHSEVIDNAIAATTSSTGLTEGKHCSVCQTVLVAQQVIPKLEASPAEMTKLMFEGIGNTYSYYLPTEKKSSTYIHSGEYKVVTIGKTYIELQVDLIAELTYANWNTISFRYELHNSDGICVKSGTIHKSASKGTKYNIHMVLPISKADNYTLKFFDITP